MENHDFGIALAGVEEEGLGHGDEGGEGADARGGGVRLCVSSAHGLNSCSEAQAKGQLAHINAA